MKIENSIGWCDETINAVTGCEKVSPGCKNCYAQVGTRARVLRGGGDKRWPDGVETWGANGVRVPVNFEPVFRSLNKLCVCDWCHTAHPVERITANSPKQICYKMVGNTANGLGLMPCLGTLRRIRLFADSNSDWLDAKWPIETLAAFLDAIRLAPNIDVLLLTKRIENWRGRMLDARNASMSRDFIHWMDDWYSGVCPSNVWLGVSVENQKYADERIPKLLETPAAVRFISAEPLLQNVDIRLQKDHHLPPLSWCVVGGESGKDRRDCGVDSIVSVHDQCVAAGVPVYVKQDVAFKSGQQGRIPGHVWRRKEFPSPQR